jgi:phosphonate degradation associated HDIG domain protein
VNVIDRLFQLFRDAGQGAYFGEQVSEMEHALQAAHLAEKSGAADELVAAALLHDVGHLLHHLGEDVAERGIDASHERLGADWLAAHFVPAVVAAVGLHVEAKRYLCTGEEAYVAALSPASRRSLQLQGGPMCFEEVRRFEESPFFEAAVAVRGWDDAAKVPGLSVPGLEHYRSRLEAVLLREAT